MSGTPTTSQEIKSWRTLLRDSFRSAIRRIPLCLKFLFLEMKPFIDRAYAKVADQSDDEQARHQVHRRSVEPDAARTVSLQILPNVIDEHRPQNSRHGPGR